MTGTIFLNFHLNQFESNITRTLQQLQAEKHFCDITLACENEQILAHKIILSNSSPVLKNILIQSTHHNQIIYLRGVKYKYLESLISFMYQGEVTITDEDLQEFLQVAEDLKVEGLTLKDAENVYQCEALSNILNGEHPEKDYQNLVQISEQPKKMSNHAPKSIISDTKLPVFEPNENGEISKHMNEKMSVQNLINVSDAKKNVCDICNKLFSRSDHLKRHKSSVHEGVKYPCDQCDTSPFKWQRNLTNHKTNVHEGVIYPCDECNDLSFSLMGDLKRHKNSVHKGVRYPCDQCEITPFNYAYSLKYHISSVHQGIRYECFSCNYKFTLKSNLKNHIKKIHKI